MTDRRTRIKVGVFALAAAALAVLVLLVFGGIHLLRKSDHYTVDSPDTVMGLEPGALVYINGIDVGVVTDIRLAPGDLRRVEIGIDVEHGTPIHADTRAFISLPGLMGLKVIDLRGGSYGAPIVPPGGRIAAGEGTLDKLQRHADLLAEQTGVLVQRAGSIADHADEVMRNLSTIVDADKMRAIEGDLAAAARGLRAMVDENRATVRDATQSFAAASRRVSDVMATQVTSLATNTNDLVADLRGMVRGNQTAIQGTLADLRQAAKSFKELAREVKQKPSRLLFSDAERERSMP